MDRKETKKFISNIDRLYPSYFRNIDPKGIVDIWGDVFSEMPYNFAYKALIGFAKDGNRKYPTVNELYQRAKQIERDDFFEHGGRT